MAFGTVFPNLNVAQGVGEPGQAIGGIVLVLGSMPFRIGAAAPTVANGVGGGAAVITPIGDLGAVTYLVVAEQAGPV